MLVDSMQMWDYVAVKVTVLRISCALKSSQRNFCVQSTRDVTVPHANCPLETMTLPLQVQ